MNNQLYRLIERQIRKTFLLFVAFLITMFALAQLVIVQQHYRAFKKDVDQWFSVNTGRVEEALFIGNDFSVANSIQRLLGRVEYYKIVSATIYDKDGSIKMMVPADAEPPLTPPPATTGFTDNFFRTKLEYFRPLSFADLNQGSIYLRIRYDLWQPLLNSGWLVAICLLSFVFFQFLLQGFMRTIRKKVFEPIVNLSESLNSSVDNLEMPRKLDDSYKNSVQEVTQLVEGYNRLVSHIGEISERQQSLAAMEAQFQIASQVAHDIRSPLVALEMSLKSLPEVSEDKRLTLRSALSRIKDIANNLLVKHPAESFEMAEAAEPPESDLVLVSGVLESIVSEKRTQYTNLHSVEILSDFGSQAYGTFAKFNSSSIKRILSNLIDNSVEALDGKGSVLVTHTQTTTGEVEISIRDNGCGIPAHLISTLGQRGATFNKDGGTGLGLYHAKKAVEAWHGRLTLESEEGVGTTVKIHLPKEPPPEWFCSEILLAHHSLVAILDDDSSIHHIWRGRFESAGAARKQVELVNFSTPTEFRMWASSHIQSNLHTSHLIDYEFLNFDEDGLDVIETLGIARNSVLVTSRFEEKHVREHAQRLGVTIIPKNLAPHVPIRIVSEQAWLATQNSASPLADIVLIDDDELVHMSWRMTAKDRGIALAAFYSVEDFYGSKLSTHRNLPIYVDVSLAQGVNGVEVARKLHDEGFHNLYLATGHAESRFSDLDFLKGVIGKSPPWEASP